MKLYHVELTLRSRLRTPLEADTLWGHIAWGIRYSQGEKVLSDWLGQYDQPEPPLVLASPCPQGYLPAPMLPPLRDGKLSGSIEEFRERKTARKIRWIPRDQWPDLATKIDHASLATAAAGGAQAGNTPYSIPPLYASILQTHAGINRLTQSTASDDGGQLFIENTYFPTDTGRVHDLWCASPESAEKVRQWLDGGLSGGYGRDASNGCGHIKVTKVEAVPWPSVPNANAMLLLGSCSPCPHDPPPAVAQWTFRCGRLSNAFPSNQRQKHPIRMIAKGSLLQAKPDSPRIVGQLVTGVHLDSSIRHYAMTLAWPCRLVGDTLAFVQGEPPYERL